MNAEALIGTVLGNCTLQRLIGQGGMGAVYLAQQERPRRQIAVKVLMPATTLKPHQLLAFLERFRRETDAAASLEHPNIMPVYEYGERDNLAYLVMPYISAGTLRDVMERDDQLSFTAALSYLEQMAAALDCAHAHGVIHRDIKPANMLLTPDGRLLLTDFGLVKILTDNSSEQLRLTGAGAPVGTPDYMSPEQVIGGEVSGRSDQYGLAVVLFQMLTGTTPFQGETPMQIASQQLHMPPPAPRSLRPDLPEEAERVLLRALAKRPAERFASAQEFASAFRAALVEQSSTGSLGISTRTHGLLAQANLRKGSLFDPQWQSTNAFPPIAPSPALPNTGRAFSAEPSASFAARVDPFEHPTGTGLLSKTGRFPRVGLKEMTGALPATNVPPAVPTSPFSTGQLMAATSTQSTYFASSTGALPQPFPTGALQQLSPITQGTTSALNLLKGEPQANNTIKLTGAVKVVQVPVAPGQYVTGLLPVQQAVSGPLSEPGIKRGSAVQKVVLIAALFVLLVGGIGAVAFTRAHRTPSPAAQSTSSTNTINPTASSQAKATATAAANILFSDALTQNIHGFQTDGQHFFKDNAYHIMNQSSNSAAEVAPQSFLETTLNYQLTMQEIHGNDQSPTNTFGMILRYNQQSVQGKQVNTFYSFEILNEKSSYQYSFYKYDSSKSTPWTQIGKPITAGQEFHGGEGANAVNTIRVLASGSHFTFFINGKQVGTAQDTFLQSGSMGMLVNLKGTEVAFSNMLITRN